MTIFWSYQPIDKTAVELANQPDPSPEKSVDVIQLETIPSKTITIQKDLVNPIYPWLLLFLMSLPMLCLGGWFVRRYQQRLMWLEQDGSREDASVQGSIVRSRNLYRPPAQSSAMPKSAGVRRW